jgi:hypothetical protein
MSENELIPQLELLVPWELPIEQQLSEASKAKLSKVLDWLLQSLKQTSPQKALLTINQSLFILGAAEVYLAKISSTKASLEGWEVEDFNNYFGINHVETQEPALCLVKGVLVAYQTFLHLSSQSSWLDPAQVELQKRGFASYARLLARVFDLRLEETE